MNRILVVGPEFHGYTENIQKSFKNSGVSADLIVYKLKGGRFHRLGDINKIEKFNLDIQSAIIQAQYSRIVFVRGSEVYSETLGKIKSLGIPRILFLQDALANSGNALTNVRLYDKVLLFDKSDQALLDGMGVKASFYGSPVAMWNYHPIENIEQDIDLCFVGKLYDNRVDLLENLMAVYPQKKIVVVGQYLPKARPSRWNRFYKYYFQGYRNVFLNKELSHLEINRLYNRSKICLNIQHSQSRWSCSYRTIEILAAKSFKICSKNEYMESSHSESGVVLYGTVQELKDKIDYYLQADKERLSHAQKGYTYALRHSYEAKAALFDI